MIKVKSPNLGLFEASMPYYHDFLCRRPLFNPPKWILVSSEMWFYAQNPNIQVSIQVSQYKIIGDKSANKITWVNWWLIILFDMFFFPYYL